MRLDLAVAALALLAMGPAAAQDAPVRLGPNSPKTLAIGSTAPDFSLPAVDGKTYSLKDFASSKVLVVAFMCNHCPVASMYENRVKKITADYRDRGVAVVAIQPNNPNSIELEERGHTDLGDTIQEMKVRADYRHMNYPYLYDGETQAVSRLYGPVATPHVFIFDQERKLKYQGHIDNNSRENLVTNQTARDAIEAVLAGKPVAAETTPAMGCSIKWAYKQDTVTSTTNRFNQRPVTVELIGAEQLRALRKNGTGNILLVNFWATWCGPCIEEFHDLVDMTRMYARRNFQMVTVSTNYPDEKNGVLKVLQENHAALSKNYVFGTTDPYELIGAWDKTWSGGVPFTLVIGMNGEVLYKALGAIDPVEIRRTLLKNFPDNDQYVGLHEFWNQPVDK